MAERYLSVLGVHFLPLHTAKENGKKKILAACRNHKHLCLMGQFTQKQFLPTTQNIQCWAHFLQSG